MKVFSYLRQVTLKIRETGKEVSSTQYHSFLAENKDQALAQIEAWNIFANTLYRARNSVNTLSVFYALLDGDGRDWSYDPTDPTHLPNHQHQYQVN